MAEAPVKDVFADDEDSGVEDDQRVIDEVEEAEQKAGAEEAATKAGDDDIEVVLAEEEAKAEAEDDDKEDDDKSLAAVPGAEEPEAEGDEVGDDLKDLSKNMQKRIARERRIRDREREEAQTAIVKERGQRIEAERRSLTAHKNLTEVLLVNIDGQIKAKSTELKALLNAAATGEEGATEKQVDVQGELDDLRAKKREIEDAKVSLANQTEEFERQAKVIPVTAPKISQTTQSWLGQNKWFGKKGFAAETLLVRDLDVRLAGARMDKGSPEYFRELNRQIKAEMPDLDVKVRRAFKPDRGVRSAVAPVSRSSTSVQTNAAGKRRVTLDRADLQNMRNYKIDTSDPKAVALYAREKLAASKGAE